MIQTPSIRAQVVTRRSYNRPMSEDGKIFETWADTIDRVVGHQRWLWERALNRQLLEHEISELEELRRLMLERKSLLSGRTLWLGGTEVAKRREASNFNCSFLKINTVHDIVDAMWLLLQGCFVRGTKIKMADGSYKSIEDIKVGDYVVSYNEEFNNFEPNAVDALLVNDPKPLVCVTFESGESVTCTEDHPFLIDDGRWLSAKDILGLDVVSANE